MHVQPQQLQQPTAQQHIRIAAGKMCGRYDAGRSDNIEEPAGEYLNIFSIPLRTYLTHLCKSAMDELNQKEIELRRRNDEIDAKRNRKATDSGSSKCSPTRPPPGTKIPVRHPPPVPKSNKKPLRRRSTSTSSQKGEIAERMIDEIENLRRDNASIRSDADKARAEVRKLKSELRSASQTAEKKEAHSTETEEKLRMKEEEAADLKKTASRMEETLKRMKSESNADAVRLNRQQEEIERIRESEQRAKEQIKELSRRLKEQSAESAAVLKAKEKQLANLLEAFKKQIELINVLKQQKLHLEASHVLKYAEKEFIDSLDWRPFADAEEKDGGKS